MKITIENVEWLPEGKQQALGLKFLQAMYFENIVVDGVRVEFEE